MPRSGIVLPMDVGTFRITRSHYLSGRETGVAGMARHAAITFDAAVYKADGIGGGTHNGFTLTRSTVKEDSSADLLIGNTGRDWYLRNSVGTPTIFRQTVTDADLDSLFTEIDSWF